MRSQNISAGAQGCPFCTLSHGAVTGETQVAPARWLWSREIHGEYFFQIFWSCLFSVSLFASTFVAEIFTNPTFEPKRLRMFSLHMPSPQGKVEDHQAPLTDRSVCVIGGGPSGLGCCRRLCDAGLRVTLIQESRGGLVIAWGKPMATYGNYETWEPISRSENFAFLRNMMVLGGDKSRGGAPTIRVSVTRFGWKALHQVCEWQRCQAESGRGISMTITIS